MAGIVFCWGTLVSGSYVPTATTWMYGSYQLVTAQLPLTLAHYLTLIRGTK